MIWRSQSASRVTRNAFQIAIVSSSYLPMQPLTLLRKRGFRPGSRLSQMRLRDSIASDSVDLIYLDPPFNSQANYNVLFKAPSGQQSEAQIEAFEDTWHWNDHAENAFDEVMKSGNADVAELLRALRSFLKENDMMAYLTMMAIRLLELHRVLKPTGSLYLHCDPTASHYLKIVLDGVFGKENYRSEISWKRSSTKSDFAQGAKNWPRIHDVILYYAKNVNNLKVF